jgi:hypothetical protein
VLAVSSQGTWWRFQRPMSPIFDEEPNAPRKDLNEIRLTSHGSGFFFGLLAGPIGWLIIAIEPNLKPKVASPNAPAASPKLETKRKLTDLKALFDDGVISQADFERKKQELLTEF